MKKFIALILSLSFFFSLSVSTLAKDYNSEKYAALQNYNLLCSSFHINQWTDYDNLKKCFNDLAENPLQTERLIVEKVCEDHIPHLAELLMNPDVIKYLNSHESPPFKTKEDALAYVKLSLKLSTIKFTIKLKDTKTIIGSVSYTVVPSSKQIFLGYYLGKPYQHKGYASEAVAALTSKVLGSVKSGILSILYNPKNLSSEKLAKCVLSSIIGAEHSKVNFTAKNENYKKNVCEYKDSFTKSIIGFSVKTKYLNQEVNNLSFIKCSKEGLA